MKYEIDWQKVDQVSWATLPMDDAPRHYWNAHIKHGRHIFITESGICDTKIEAVTCARRACRALRVAWQRATSRSALVASE
jgi:hypothetical protein